jgi:hypothetical protein
MESRALVLMKASALNAIFQPRLPERRFDRQAIPFATHRHLAAARATPDPAADKR